MNETLDNQIQDPEKAHAMALAGDGFRTEAVQKRQKAAAIQLAKLAYEDTTDQDTRKKILNGAFTEVGVNDFWSRPDIVGRRPGSFRSRNLGNNSSQDDINARRDRQIASFLGSHTRYEDRAQELESLAEEKESWAELIFDNPAVEHYKKIHPELNIEDQWRLECIVNQARAYYEGHLSDIPRYREVLQDGKYVPGGLLQHLFPNSFSEEDEEEFEPNSELLKLLNNGGTTVDQLREFLLRQEEIKLEAEKKRAEDLTQMLADIKKRQLSANLEN